MPTKNILNTQNIHNLNRNLILLLTRESPPDLSHITIASKPQITIINAIIGCSLPNSMGIRSKLIMLKYIADEARKVTIECTENTNVF
jgi:hypothetical protein